MKLDSLASSLGVPGSTGYTFDRAVIDSRLAGPGCVFFALPGTRVDGNDFVGEALEKGAGAVVSRAGFQGPVLTVPDVPEALFQAGIWARSRFNCTVAAITGSSGKTTTRELLLAALRSRIKADGTRGNLNNMLGLPLTLLNASPDVSALVLELGMNHPGELLRLGEAARPEVSIVTNIGSAHMEFFRNREELAAAKAELLRATVEGGSAVIPAGEPVLLEACRENRLSITTTGPGGDVRMEGGVFKPWGIVPRLSIPGTHNFNNALSAVAAAELIGVDPADALSAMEEYHGMPGRGRVLKLKGVTLFDESYNSNPESAVSCLGLLENRSGSGIAVLGDMLELGSLSPEAHRAVLTRATGMGLRLIITVGEAFRRAMEEADFPGVIWAPDPERALSLLLSELRRGDSVLVKGSNSIGLATVVRGLQEGVE